jgi:hypothetical protein
MKCFTIPTAKKALGILQTDRFSMKKYRAAQSTAVRYAEELKMTEQSLRSVIAQNVSLVLSIVRTIYTHIYM